MAKEKKLVDVIEQEKNNEVPANPKQNPLDAKIAGEIRTWIETFRKTIHNDWKGSIKSYRMDKLDRKIALIEQNRPYDSNHYMPFIKNLVDKTFAHLYDTEIDFIVNADTKQYRKGEKHIKTLLRNWFINPKNRKNFFTSVKNQIISGNWFGKASIVIKSGWGFETRIEYVPLFNFYFNPNLSLYDSWYPVIERSIKTQKEVIKETEWLFTIDPSTLELAIKKPKPFSTYDDNRVWDMWTRYDDLSCDIVYDDHRKFDDSELYKVTKFDNNIMELVWRWTDDNIVVYLNGYMVYDGGNPLGMHPYFNLQFDPSSGRELTRGIASTHMDAQMEVNNLHNKIQDDMRLASTNIWKATGEIEGIGDVFYPKNGTVLQMLPWSTLERFADFTFVNPQMYNVIADLIARSENEVGLNNLTGGQSGAKERSSFAAQASVNVTAMVLQPITEGIGVALTRISYIWQKLITKYVIDNNMDGKIELRTYENDYEKLDTKYLEWEYNIVFTNKALVSLNNYQRVLDKISILNQASPWLTDQATGVNYIDKQQIAGDIVKQLWYEEDMLLTQDEFNKRMIEVERGKIKTQIDLLGDQANLETKRQELMNQMSWQNQIQQPQANVVQQGNTIPENLQEVDLWM